jgi:hypothetical protein
MERRNFLRGAVAAALAPIAKKVADALPGVPATQIGETFTITPTDSTISDAELDALRDRFVCDDGVSAWQTDHPAHSEEVHLATGVTLIVGPPDSAGTGWRTLRVL